jgi:hypothetical protein
MEEAKPKWKAEFYVKAVREQIATLGDTGCMKCCMSEEFFRQHPELRDNNFRPTSGYGKAVNGSRVLEVGIVKLSFRIDDVHMSMNFRIVRGLIHPLILGWDFFSKYQAWLDPAGGTLQYQNGRKAVSLIEDSHGISGCYYRVHEDITIPGNSKMHVEIELMVDAEALKLATDLVTTEPFPHQGEPAHQSKREEYNMNSSIPVPKVSR